MNTKNLMVSLCAVAIAMFLVVTVSAANLASNVEIEVDDINVADNPAVVAGETVAIEVVFTADVDASDVRVKAEIEGDKVDLYVMSKSFDVEAGHTYKKTLTIKVPFELKDELSDDVHLNVKIWNGDDETEFENMPVRVQRPSYNPDVKSVSVPQNVDAGETFPVDIVLKNMGYNDLDDIYVTVSVPELGVKKTSYFGDLVPLETCNDDCEEEDTVSGRLFLEVPYEAEAGVYELEVNVKTDDVDSTVSKQVAIKNDFSSNVIVTSSGKSANVGQDAEYSLLLVNPTNSLKVYRVVTESSGELCTGVDESVVAVPAGSSKTVTVMASASEAGEYNFDVHIFSGEKLTDTVALSLTAEDNAASNPIVVLTVVLAIIFLVLLIVLIVLLGRKPKKQEEFGESYY
jgi:uncharacterized membrane protein